jgi:hypothetical protein
MLSFGWAMDGIMLSGSSAPTRVLSTIAPYGQRDAVEGFHRTELLVPFR